MTENQEAVLLWAINTYGVENQTKQALSEMGELITALERRGTERFDRENVIEEIADCIIMCQQLRTIYGAAEVDKWIEKKTGRLFLRLRELSLGDRP